MGKSVIGRIVGHAAAQRKLTLCLALGLMLACCDRARHDHDNAPAAPQTTSSAEPAPPQIDPSQAGAQGESSHAVEPTATTCQRQLAQEGIRFQPAAQPDAPKSGAQAGCHVVDPVTVAGVIHGVSFIRANEREARGMLVACDLALALGALARQARKQNIQRVVHLGTTQCRTIADTQVLSQHAFGRAIDISAFHLDNGRVVRVLQDWERGQPQPRTQPGRLLRDFAMALHRDQVFNVVLTPEYNEAHWDHFHLDLTRDRHFLSQGPADILVGD